MLGDGGDEVARGENLEVALDLRVHAGTVDDGTLGRRPVGRVQLHLLDREGIPDDVLREPLHILTLVGQHAAAAMDVEARMHPTPEHVRPFYRQQALVHQKRDDPSPEQLLQRLEADIR